MRFLVFPYDPTTLMGSLKYSLKINIDAVNENNYGMSVVVSEQRRKARIYRNGCFDEYEITNITELGGNKYYILGKLLSHQKPDYLEPIENKEVLSC